MQNNSKFNMFDLIKKYSFTNPTKLLMVVDDDSVTYNTFVTDTNIISNSLSSMGIVPNQKIGIILPNSILWYKIYWAIVKIGAQPVPLDPQIGEWEMERLLSISDIKICFVATKYRANNILDNITKVRTSIPDIKTIISIDSTVSDDGILPFERFLGYAKEDLKTDYTYTPEESHTLMLACTSGSTGNPKIIAVPHLGFYKSQYDMAEYLGFINSDVMLLGMPLYHQGGFGMGLQMILKGGTVFYQPVFEPVKFLSMIEQKKITVVQLTATLAKILLSVPEFYEFDLSSVRICYFAGEVLPLDIAKVFFEKLGIRVVNVIGSSETCTMVVWDSDYDRDVDVNIFRPLDFTQMKVLDSEYREVSNNEIGTIFIHTDGLITEYYKNEDETISKLHMFDNKMWFNTGDLGEKRPDGRVRFTGRAKRIIKRGSNLVWPEEIEAFILTHPNIEAVAVMGEKHELFGEMIVAYIQPKKGFIMTHGELIKFCRHKLAAYKLPDKVIVMEEVPHDIGKVQFKYIT